MRYIKNVNNRQEQEPIYLCIQVLIAKLQKHQLIIEIYFEEVHIKFY